MNVVPSEYSQLHTQCMHPQGKKSGLEKMGQDFVSNYIQMCDEEMC